MYMYVLDIDGGGLFQPTTKYTMDTKKFREFYLAEPWDRWAIGTFDSYMHPLDLPGILPSNQCVTFPVLREDQWARFRRGYSPLLASPPHIPLLGRGRSCTAGNGLAKVIC